MTSHGEQASWSEVPVHIGEGARLSGVVTIPREGPEDAPALVLLNAGATHRIGPNRLHVRLARRLAAAGTLVLRFDTAGVGDSETRRDGMPYVESVFVEVREALDLLAERFGVRRFVLGGICSGLSGANKFRFSFPNRVPSRPRSQTRFGPRPLHCFTKHCDL